MARDRQLTDDKHELKFLSNQGVLPIGMGWWRAKPPMLVSKKAMTMPPCKVTALFEIMQYGVHRILTMQILCKRPFTLRQMIGRILRRIRVI